MSVTDPLLKTLKLQILELHRCFQFLTVSGSNSVVGESAVEGCSSADSKRVKAESQQTEDENHAQSHEEETSYEPITDSHPYLIPLCQTLEEIFRKGLLPTTGSLLSLTVKKDDYWRWIESLLGSSYKLPLPLRAAIDATRKDERVLTYVGRGWSIMIESM